MHSLQPPFSPFSSIYRVVARCRRHASSSSRPPRALSARCLQSSDRPPPTVHHEGQGAPHHCPQGESISPGDRVNRFERRVTDRVFWIAAAFFLRRAVSPPRTTLTQSRVHASTSPAHPSRPVTRQPQTTLSTQTRTTSGSPRPTTKVSFKVRACASIPLRKVGTASRGLTWTS